MSGHVLAVSSYQANEEKQYLDMFAIPLFNSNMDSVLFKVISSLCFVAVLWKKNKLPIIPVEILCQTLF